MDSVIPSSVRNHDLTEMAAAFEMPVGLLCFGERECAVDDGPQAMHRDGPIHRLEIARLTKLARIPVAGEGGGAAPPPPFPYPPCIAADAMSQW
jgi:hypothetical protein